MNEKFTEYETVKNLLDEYAQAVYQADIGKLKGIFHPDASLTSFLDGALYVGSTEPFLAELQSKASMAFTKDDFRYIIDSLKVVGAVASANLFIDGFYGEHCIQDCLHLAKENGQWKIVGKIYTVL